MISTSYEPTVSRKFREVFEWLSNGFSSQESPSLLHEILSFQSYTTYSPQFNIIFHSPSFSSRFFLEILYSFSYVILSSLPDEYKDYCYCDVTQCSLAERHRRFGDVSRLHFRNILYSEINLLAFEFYI
jgi:hypothetical protein